MFRNCKKHACKSSRKYLPDVHDQDPNRCIDSLKLNALLQRINSCMTFAEDEFGSSEPVSQVSIMIGPINGLHASGCLGATVPARPFHGRLRV